MALTILREIWLSGTLRRFSSNTVAITLPAASTITVRCASGSVFSSAGSLVIPEATCLVPMPSTPAKGIARPAATSPMTAATASMTTTWPSTRGADRRSDRGRAMAKEYGTSP